ncbi:C39 family peptidase [Candidatus Parcubacteria bacterium]|nr:C39 family peptidase [Candidatus Parcubacteria bacterium]
MIKKIDVPYYSQYEDVKDEYWKPRACGVVCLKMVLDYIKPDKILVNDFVLLANEKGAYGESGWIHQGLIDVAKSFGVNLKRKEFKSEDKNEEEKLLEQGIREIVFSLKENKPVLISTIKKWNEEKKFHMIVLVGFKKGFFKNLKGFYYNDSDYKNCEGKHLFVDIKTFKKYWRRLAIFVE